MTKTYPNSGAIFTNNKKEKDTHPDYTGYIQFDKELLEFMLKDEMKCDISCWIKTSSRGNTFLSVSAKKPYKFEAKNISVEENTDDIPF